MNRYPLYSCILLAALAAGCHNPEDPGVANSAFNGVTRGCGDFLAYRESADRSRYLVAVSGPSHPGHSADTAYETQVGTAQGVTVYIATFADAARGPEWFCNDVVTDAHPLRLDTALEGEVSVRVRDYEGIHEPWHTPYELDLHLRDVRFKEGGVESVRFDSVWVGWLPG